MLRVAEKQEHIGQLAKQHPTLRFDRLYRVLCDEAWLTTAWERIRQNKGSKTAGVDGQTKDDVDAILIRNLATKLKAERYEPTPVRRVHIPKAGGKRRPLGIPTIRDRIVQSALKMLLEPIWEADFRDCSHGFRPGRSCHTALNRVAIRFPRTAWVIEGDIKGCYDTIDHERLLCLMSKRIKDMKLLGLIRKFLKAGYLEKWEYHRTYSGTPQGGIVSPLLANIYLHEFDLFLEDTLGANPKETVRERNQRRNPVSVRIASRLRYIRQILDGRVKWKVAELTADRRQELVAELKTLRTRQSQTTQLLLQQKLGYVRYADDFLIILQGMTKAEAGGIKEQVRRFLQEHLALELSVDKTLITHPTDPFRFLGYDLCSREGRRKTLKLDIPRAARTDLLNRVSRLTRLHHIAAVDLLTKVNALLRGWMEYYKYASAPQRTFSRVLSQTWWMVARYLARKHKTSIAQMCKRHAVILSKNGRSRTTLQIEVKGKRFALWMFPPQSGAIHRVFTQQPTVDDRPKIVHEWLRGRSIEKRVEALIEADHRCQVCGTTERLEVHHRGGLKGKQGLDLARAGQDKQRVVLCKACHVSQGHGGRLS